MRFDRERYVSLMTFGHVERDMFVELFGPLVGLEEEWRAQGADAGELRRGVFAGKAQIMSDHGAERGLPLIAAAAEVSSSREYEIPANAASRTARTPASPPRSS